MSLSLSLMGSEQERRKWPLNWARDRDRDRYT